jgi:phage gp29-like protein
MESEALRLTNLFKKLPISDTIENIIYGKLKGMAVFELVWGFNNGSGYYLKDIVPLDATKIAVNGKNEIIYDNLYNVSDEKYKYKFIVYRNKSYQNPYGVAEILKCYYAWLFKKAGWKFWMVTTEKYSVPTLIVNFDPSEIDDPQLKADELATAFYNIQSDAVIVTNGLSDKNGIVKLDVNAKADEFRTLINKAEEAISKVIIGTHVLMDGTSGGSRSLAEVAANINFRYKVQALIIEVCSVFNKLLILESELQTGKENPYNNEFTIPYVNIQDWEKTREAITLGIPVSKKSIYYHVDKPIDDEDIFVQEPKVTSVAYDHPNITDEKDADTDDTRGRKTIPKKQETREATKDTGK